MEVSARLDRLRHQVVKADALLVTNVTNVRYLTGFTGSAGMLFLLPSELVFVTDGRYGTQAGEELAAAGVDARIVVARAADQAERAQEIVEDGDIRRLALEAAHVSWARQRSLAADWFPGVELLPTVDLVESLRPA
jgi:Xaa-Pro aminopeptidase